MAAAVKSLEQRREEYRADIRASESRLIRESANAPADKVAHLVRAHEKRCEPLLKQLARLDALQK